MTPTACPYCDLPSYQASDGRDLCYLCGDLGETQPEDLNPSAVAEVRAAARVLREAGVDVRRLRDAWARLDEDCNGMPPERWLFEGLGRRDT